MLQAVHSEQVAVPAEAGGGESAPEAFGPFLRLALDEAALLGSIAAQPTAGALAAAALGGGAERGGFSAAGHWARESLARAQGQKLGVNLAEIAAGELASPAEPRSQQAAPAAGRDTGARPSGDGALPPREQAGRAPEGQGGERQAAESSADPDNPDDGELPPAAEKADRAGRALRSASGGLAVAGAAVAAAAPGGGGAAAAGAGQSPGATSAISPVSASAWKLDAAGRPGIAARQAGAGGPAAGQSAERAIQSQMERGLGAVLRQGGGSLTLKLAPASLGEVRIQMTLEGGAVRARFESASGEARELMVAGLGALRAALEARGLRVESLEVVHEPAERADRGQVAEPPRSESQPEAARQGETGRGGDRADDGGRSAAEGEGRESGAGEDGRRASPERGAGRTESGEALEDPAIMHTADGQSETLVSLRLDTVA